MTLPNPSIQVDATPVAIGVSGEVSQIAKFWDSGTWDTGTWDEVNELVGAPSIQVDSLGPSIEVT